MSSTSNTLSISSMDLHCILSSASSNLNGVLALEAGTIDAVIKIPENHGHYKGNYNVRSRPNKDVLLDTSGKVMDDDLLVERIEYSETSNDSGGYTVYIA